MVEVGSQLIKMSRCHYFLLQSGLMAVLVVLERELVLFVQPNAVPFACAYP